MCIEFISTIPFTVKYILQNGYSMFPEKYTKNTSIGWGGDIFIPSIKFGQLNSTLGSNTKSRNESQGVPTNVAIYLNCTSKDQNLQDEITHLPSYNVSYAFIVANIFYIRRSKLNIFIMIFRVKLVRNKNSTPGYNFLQHFSNIFIEQCNDMACPGQYVNV